MSEYDASVNIGPPPRFRRYLGPHSVQLVSSELLTGLLRRTSRAARANGRGTCDHKKTAHKGGFSRWRWARDSNPGNLSVQRFSRPPLSTTQPAHLNLYRRLSKEAPHYSDATLTIKLPERYFLPKMNPLVRRSLSDLVDR